MRHHDQRRAFAPVEFEKKFEHLLAGLAVEITGRLVGEQNRRLGDEGARESHALLFAAGELNRVVIEAIGQADACKEFARALRRFRTRAGQFGGQQDILFRGQRRDQLEGLKNEADLASAHLGHAGLRRGR